MKFVIAFFLVCFTTLAQLHEKPLSPSEAQKAFRLEPELKIELVLAEPEVIAPCALAFDELGTMYVAENRGYPTNFNQGRIAMFRLDGDKFSERLDFVERLNYPNGVLPWAGGLIVTCAPDVLYFKDTDGDGHADIRQVILTGFATNGSTQLRVSHPTFGPDDWIYLSGGLSGGKVTSPLVPERTPIDISRSEIRFRLQMADDGKVASVRFEGVDGKGQFGLCIDDFGHRFTCMNRVQAQEVVLPSRYLKRNPNLIFTDSMQDLPEELDPGLHLGPPAAHIFPISHNLTTADSHLGTFTAACAVTVYRGDALPAEMYGNVFSCDPAANLVHGDLLLKHGATHLAKRAAEKTEFLASSDDWFRPVFLQTGPDGALYLCDMYRRTIEHPGYLPEEVRKKTDFESGRNCGRIWRVYKTKNALTSRTPGQAKPMDLISALGHKNSWQRETAQRLLFERGASNSVEILLSADLKSAEGQARTLRLLADSHELKPEKLINALGDANPGVRETAVELSEPFLNDSPSLLKKITDLSTDPDSHVHFRVALAFGELRSTLPVVGFLARIALQPDTDKWTEAAILSSSYGTEPALLKSLLKNEITNQEPRLIHFLDQLSALAGKEKNRGYAFDDLPKKPLPIQFAVLNGVARETGALPSIDQIDLPRLARSARKIGADPAETVAAREAAIRFARWIPQIQYNELLPLLNPSNRPELQRAVVQTILAKADDHTVAAVVTAPLWNELSPNLREEFLNGVISNPRLATQLLDQLSSNNIPPGAISSAQRKQLQNAKDPVIKERSVALFRSSGEEDRMKVYESYKSILREKADPLNGRKVFTRVCATCHRLDQEGTPVGPDLFSIRNQPKEVILLHVIVPDYEIALGFNNYTVEVKDGRTLSGIIRSENESAITLRSATGRDEAIPRASIVTLQASKNSMMPQELEKTMTRQELADLISYVKGE